MKIIVETINKYSDEDKRTEALRTVRAFDPDRAEAIDRNGSDVNCRRLLTAGMMLKDMCDRFVVNDPVWAKGEHGKPYIENHPELQFNLSHSGDYVALAYGDDPVGVDIQEVRKVTDSFGKRILNESELEAYDIEDPVAICRLWTIKEAYLKLIGRGLSYDFRNCIIDKANALVRDTTGEYPDATFRTHRVADNVYLTYVRYKDK